MRFRFEHAPDRPHQQSVRHDPAFRPAAGFQPDLAQDRADGAPAVCLARLSGSPWRTAGARRPDAPRMPAADHA
ncbi:hypothetical protein G6F65_023064 [Rhizopus arrhizus]|nr:hypothetical protein G6F65_023064 [Rhizopus arrhizus]